MEAMKDAEQSTRECKPQTQAANKLDGMRERGWFDRQRGRPSTQVGE